MENKRLSSCERREIRPKHCALTKFLRNHDLRRAYDLEKIIEKCEVNPHVGCLPPELRNLVNKSDLSQITAKFFDLLDFFVTDKKTELLQYVKYKYDIPEISALFDTECVLETAEQVFVNLTVDYREWAQDNGLLQWQTSDDDLNVYRVWTGAVGNIYKLSFPQIGVSYALKVFKDNIIPAVGHGSVYEIPNALRANKSEPKLNTKIYLANLFGATYMLSEWVKVTPESQKVPLIKKKYKFFITSKDEKGSRNYCNGKRLDFGKTRRTYYGNAYGPVRKLYRQMLRMNEDQIKELESKQKNNFDKRDFLQAQDIIYYESANQKSGR